MTFRFLRFAREGFCPGSIAVSVGIKREYKGLKALFSILLSAALVAASSAAVFAQPQKIEEISPSFILQTQKGIQEYTGEKNNLQKSGVKKENQAASKAKNRKGVSFVLKRVEFNRSKFLKKGQIDKIIKPFTGKKVDFEDLQTLINGINGLYRQKGIFTALAVIPPQTIKNGVVRISLVEGKLGSLAVKNRKYTRLSFIENRIPLKSGETIDLNRLNRDIVFFNRTTGLNMKANVEPGASFGQTNVVLDVMEPGRTALQFFADNYGSTSTGRDELGAAFRLNGLLRADDYFSAYGIYGQNDNVYGSASYSLILDRYNGRLTLGYGRNRINIIRGPYAQLGITGYSDSGTVSFDQPLLATGSWKLDVMPSFSYTKSRTSSNGFMLSDVADYGYSLGPDLYRYFNRGMVSFYPMAQFVDSHEDFGRNRGLFMFKGFLNGYYFFNADWQAYFNSALQYSANSELSPDSLFQLGGVNSLRAYESGILSGDNGYYLQLELHRRLIGRTSGFLFADGGGVWPNPHREITDMGLGLDVAWNRFLLDLSGGYALNKVTDDQDRFRVNFRLTWNII